MKTKAELIQLKHFVMHGGLIPRQEFHQLTADEQFFYINAVSYYRNGRPALLRCAGVYYDADDFNADILEKVTSLIDYADNLHDYGFDLFKR